MPEPQTEKVLREFLAWADAQRRGGADISALIAVVQALRGEVAQGRAEVATVKRIALVIAKDRLIDKDRGERHGRRIDKLEAAMQLVTTAPAMTAVPDYHADPAERTGVHNLREIEKQTAELEERLAEREKEELRRVRESGIWWKRQGILWAAGVIGFILATGVATGCSIAAARIFPTPSAAAPK